MSDTANLSLASTNAQLPSPVILDSTDQLINLSADSLRVELPGFPDSQAYDQVLLVLTAREESKQVLAQSTLGPQGTVVEFFRNQLEPVFSADDEVRAQAYLRLDGTHQWVRAPDSAFSTFC